MNFAIYTNLWYTIIFVDPTGWDEGETSARHMRWVSPVLALYRCLHCLSLIIFFFVTIVYLVSSFFPNYPHTKFFFFFLVIIVLGQEQYSWKPQYRPHRQPRTMYCGRHPTLNIKSDCVVPVYQTIAIGMTYGLNESFFFFLTACTWRSSHHSCPELWLAGWSSAELMCSGGKSILSLSTRGLFITFLALQATNSFRTGESFFA